VDVNEPAPVRTYFLTPEEIAIRYGGSRSAVRPWAENRRRNRAAGVDRFGRPLPRVAGTNPRALGTNPLGAIKHVETRQGVIR
jgi:hypothetical protein